MHAVRHRRSRLLPIRSVFTTPPLVTQRHAVRTQLGIKKLDKTLGGYSQHRPRLRDAKATGDRELDKQIRKLAQLSKQVDRGGGDRYRRSD